MDFGPLLGGQVEDQKAEREALLGGPGGPAADRRVLREGRSGEAGDQQCGGNQSKQTRLQEKPLSGRKPPGPAVRASRTSNSNQD